MQNSEDDVKRSDLSCPQDNVFDTTIFHRRYFSAGMFCSVLWN